VEERGFSPAYAVKLQIGLQPLRKFHLDSHPFCAHTTSVKQVAYLSLGSNLGNRVANIKEAIEQIAAGLLNDGALTEAQTNDGDAPDRKRPIKILSSFYETQPVEVPDQPWFLNVVLAIETTLTPHALLNFLLSIEKRMGRTRLRNKGPRKIDIDILLLGEAVISDPALKIPHPAMHLRRFVLEPLAEIAPALRHPVLGKTALDMLADLPPSQIVRRLKEQSA